MQDQDLDVEELAKIVRRQREMGLAIHGELELQNEMLDRVDKDVDRVKGKIDIAKKRVSKIS
jgi:regulator of vacuolar morphogenesis